jgi:hypothetical protein
MSGHTVAKGIRTEDFVRHIKEMQERLFAIAPEALESFRARVKTDGDLAYTFLKDLGIIPSREAMAHLMAGDTQQAETGIERQARMIGHLMLEGNANFGISLPTDVEDALAKESGEAPQSVNVRPRLLRK